MKRNIFFTALIIICFFTSYFASKILYAFDHNWAAFLPDNAFLWETTWLALRLLPVALVVLLFSRKAFFVDLGLNANFPKAFVFALLFTLPLFIGFSIFGDFNKDLTFQKIISSSIIPGFYEELLVRSFLIGLLFRKLKWGFVPASLFGAVFFGAWHIYQGHDLLSSMFAFLTTAAGSVWFGWLYLEWRSNAWINISLHVLMNFSWLLFTVEGGAAGNIMANIFRLLTIALSIFVTIRIQSMKKGFVVNRQTLWINSTSITGNRYIFDF
ncbi:MAG: lysostaphin resistance A-like protein [Prolixibacteraceae bacterium]